MPNRHKVLALLGLLWYKSAVVPQDLKKNGFIWNDKSILFKPNLNYYSFINR